MKASCTGCNLSPLARPSMVRMDFLSASPAGVTQEATLFPSSKTVQARHWPSPQPYFAPVSWNSSRNKSSNGRSGSVLTVRDCPLTVKEIFEVINDAGIRKDITGWEKRMQREEAMRAISSTEQFHLAFEAYGRRRDTDSVGEKSLNLLAVPG